MAGFCLLAAGCGSRLEEKQKAFTEKTDTGISAASAEQTDKSESESYYGSYKIAEFLPSDHWLMGNRYDRLSEKSVSM